MTRNEMRTLSTTIKAIIGRRKFAWWQLKREIWESGYQASYPSQWDFVPQIERAVERLSPEQKACLLEEWRNAKPRRPSLDEHGFCATYTACILEEIVTRARVAAYRTVNW